MNSQRSGPRIVPDHLLSPEVTVHCFFNLRGCKHTVVATPIAAHDAMERHYESKHRTFIDALVGKVT